LEADSKEIFALLEGASTPGAAELRSRVEQRQLSASLTPPPVGEPLASGLTPATSLPRHIAELMALGGSAWPGHDPPTEEEPLHGTGIGDTVYRGRACFVTDGAEALDRMRPGDVLVAVATNPGSTPSFRSL